MLFGQLFALMSLIRSDLLAREKDSSALASQIIQKLTVLAEKKSYIKEACYEALLSLVEKSPKTPYESSVIDTLMKIVSGPSQTPEVVALLLGMQKHFPVSFLVSFFLVCFVVTWHSLLSPFFSFLSGRQLEEEGPLEGRKCSAHR